MCKPILYDATLVNFLRERQGNGVEYLELSQFHIDDLDNIQDLLQSIKETKSLRHIHFDEPFLAMTSNAERVLLMEALTYLPSLQSLVLVKNSMYNVWNSSLLSGSQQDIPVEALVNVVTRAKHLTHLELSSVHLVGTRNDLLQLMNALQTHSSLKKVVIKNCFATADTHIIDTMIQTLANVATLEELTVVLKTSLSKTSLQKLFRSQSLKVIQLGCLQLSEDDVHIIAQELRTNNNNSALRQLALIGCSGLNDRCVGFIAEMLRSNKTLQSLSLSHNNNSNNSISEVGCIEIANALCDNTSLKRLELFGCLIQERGCQALMRMLMNNFTIEYIGLNKGHRERILSKIDRLVKLRNFATSNVQDTSRSRRTLEDQEWLDSLVSVKSDLDCLYSFISMTSPLLINCGV